MEALGLNRTNGVARSWTAEPYLASTRSFKNCPECL